MQNVPNTISAPEIRYYYGGEKKLQKHCNQTS